MMTETRKRADISKLKAARKAKRWSQEKLAKAAGYALTTIQRLEQGKFFSLECLKCCAQALEIPVDDFLIGDAESPETYDLCGQLRELRALDDDGGVGELTKCYYYKIEKATLTIRGADAHLIIAKVTIYDSRSKKLSSHRLEGHGPFVDGTANILYRVEEQKGQKRRLLWAGLCILNVLPIGMIHGYWMSAGQTERGRTVLGRLELKRKCLVRESSEEARDHNQREG
jgi:transcriptional regulator with XRE-family HTH domain